MELTDSSQLIQRLNEELTMKRPYVVTVTVGKRSITLLEEKVMELERVIHVYVDDVQKYAISIPPFYAPALALDDTKVVVWGGSRIWILSMNGDRPVYFEHDDVVHKIFKTYETWCVVSELSVTLHELNTFSKMSSYFHDEVILKCHWNNEVLNFTDLQDRSVNLLVERNSLSAI